MEKTFELTAARGSLVVYQQSCGIICEEVTKRADGDGAGRQFNPKSNQKSDAAGLAETRMRRFLKMRRKSPKSEKRKAFG